MKDWLKVSFHQSGACHIKTYSVGSRPNGKKDFAWFCDELGEERPVHAMRITYDVEKQGAIFPISQRVKIMFDEWAGRGSINLDVFFVLSGEEIVPNDDSGMVAAQRLDDRRWVVFTIGTGPSLGELPDNISGMIFHLGDVMKDAEGSGANLINSTGVWYWVPEPSGTLQLIEASSARMSLDAKSP